MVEQEENKPKWLLELENRKRKPRLAHEVGAGAPCLTCESACPGLDLHFWRKICKNCKCRGDSHDVSDEDFPQFELLFGPNAKNKKHNRPVVLRVNDKKQVQKESQFEWVPPNITEELAVDYMNALPSDKLPIKGSAGAALRRQQLQKQLPLHDIDYKACDELSEQEKLEFLKYLDNLKSCAGLGKVSKLMTLKPFSRSLTTPANATDVQQFSPQHSQQLLNPGTGMNLRTPSSFIPKGIQSKLNSPQHYSVLAEPSNMDFIKMPCLQTATMENSKIGQYHHILTNVSDKNSLAQEDCPTGMYSSGKSPNLDGKSEKLLQIDSTPYELSYIKNPKFTAKEEYLHAQIGQQNLGSLNKTSKSQNEKQEMLRASNELYRLKPLTSTSQKILDAELLLELDNKPCTLDFNPESVLHQSDMDKTKHAELNTSLPVTSNLVHSQALNNPIFPECSVLFQDSNNINQIQEELEGVTINANKKYKCSKCQDNINCGDVIVTVEKIKDAVWHPGCFACYACNELLADLVYFTHKGNLYCGRDFASLLKIPRCYACDELIFVREYTVAEGHNYHVKHFCCWDCDIPLAGKQYLPENDRPICLFCYQKNYAKTCHTCKNIIAADQQEVAVKDLYFHVSDECFCCFTCKKSLLGGKLSIKESRLICSKECLAELMHRIALGR